MGLNRTIFDALYFLSNKNLFLDVLIVFFGQYLLYIMVLAAGSMIFFEPDFKRRYYFASLGILSVMLTSGIVVPAVNYLFYNPRPFIALSSEGVKALIAHSTNSSMPSGHMMFIVPIALTVFYINRRAGLWFFGGVITMGIARVVAGVHWPFDIVVGILLGTLCFYIIKGLLYIGGLKDTNHQAAHH